MVTSVERVSEDSSPLLAQRIESLRWRVSSLDRLRASLPLPPRALSDRQWKVIEQQLAMARERLLGRLSRLGAMLPAIDLASARHVADALGAIETDITYAYAFFDTFMDVLTQRLSPELGELLAGCDRIAREALAKDHHALRAVEPPIVYCDRGLGASVLREGVKYPDGARNPLPLIQIPYARLQQKYNLISAIHEAGHEALVRLRLRKALPDALRAVALHEHADPAVADLYALWAGEIGPDFWAFCVSGAGQAASLRDVLALTTTQVLALSPTDPHPPPLVRVLVSCAWCRHLFGTGPWDDWERVWRSLYPLASTPASTAKLLEQVIAHVPAIARAFFTTRFASLGRQTIPSLFDLRALEPRMQRALARRADPVDPELPLGAQLAVFRWQREAGVSEARIDERMTEWLKTLSRRNLHTN